MPMVSCNDGHDETHFEGEFRALCPLCAARAALAEAEQKADLAQQEAEASIDEDMVRLESEKNKIQEDVDKLEEAISKIVYSSGEEREAAIKKAEKLID